MIRLQAVYSAVAMGGSIAIMTVFAGFLYQHLHQGVFWVMALLTIPALVRGKLSRVQGVALLCIYAAFCAVQFTM